MVSPTLFCLLGILTAGPEHVVGVWKCDRDGNGAAAAKRNGTAANGDCRPQGFNTTSAKDTELLARALLLDPAAEHKYHVDCKEPGEIIAEAEAHKFQTRLTDLQDCKLEDDTPRVKGIERFKYGYNIITDMYTKDTAHSPILDIRSTAQFKATVLIGDKCYTLPDAFVTSASLGYDSQGFSTRVFDHIGANSTNSHREQEVNTRKVEMNLGVGVPGVVAFGAAFSSSQTTERLKSQEHIEGEDSSSIYFIEGPYGFTIQTALPTRELITEWKRVYRANTEDVYWKYFNEFGTHYYLSGVLGGRMTATFSTKTKLKRADNSNSDMRAACVGATVSGSFKGVDVDAGGGYCTSAFKLEENNSSASSFIHESKVHCEGGILAKCPDDLKDKAGFAAWRETIKENPMVMKGAKRWIYQLVEHVLTRSGMRGEQGDVYRKLIADFALTKEEDDLRVEPDPTNIVNNSIPFREFQSLLEAHMTNYLTNRTFCNLSPDNCKAAAVKPPIYWIEGVSLTGHGDWDPEAMCPPGQFIKAATRFIEEPYTWGDSTGLVKLNVRCGLLHSGEVKTEVISSGSPEAWGTAKAETVCLGDGAYLDGFLLWSLSDRYAVDKRGVTDIQFSCMKGGVEAAMPAKAVVTRGDSVTGPVKCPKGFGICGIQAKVQPNQGKGDDTAVNNFRFACCHLE